MENALFAFYLSLADGKATNSSGEESKGLKNLFFPFGAKKNREQDRLLAF